MIELLKRYWRIFWSVPVVLASLGIAGLLLMMTLAGLYLTKPAEPAVQYPTAVMEVIPGPTATAYSATATSPLDATPTSNLPPSPLPGMIGVGSYVQIFGTEGSGLNIRVSPGLGNDIVFLAYDAEVFLVGDGPVEVDGITWWYLVTPVDEVRAGWAAANYLSVVQNP